MDMKLMSLFSYPCTRIVVQTSSCLARSHFLRKQLTFPSETRHFWFMNAIKKTLMLILCCIKHSLQQTIMMQIVGLKTLLILKDFILNTTVVVTRYCTPGVPLSVHLEQFLCFSLYAWNTNISIKKYCINLVCFIKTRLPTY